MGLIHLPQTKWGSGTGRQVILKSDFDKIEQGLLESFEVSGAPTLEYLDAATVRVQATPDCRARLMMCGFPSPLASRPLGGRRPQRRPIPGKRRPGGLEPAYRREPVG